jgi:hypothetical protein
MLPTTIKTYQEFKENPYCHVSSHRRVIARRVDGFMRQKG